MRRLRQSIVCISSVRNHFCDMADEGDVKVEEKRGGLSYEVVLDEAKKTPKAAKAK